MQKHFQTKVFSFILGITFLLIPEFANAGIISLPRYTGEFAYRSNSGGRDKVCSSSYKYACSGSGYAGGVGTSCNDLYTSCSCSTNYKWSGGSCVLKSCSDYGYSASKDNTKSCEEKTPRSGLTCYVCTGCDSSTYKYACSGGLNAAEQDMANKCGTNYSECSCVEHASWNSSSGKCECGSDYKAGTTSCTLKTCEDYGYSATEDTTKNCTKQTPRSGLTCWSCSACTGTLYDCSSITNASGGSGTACGGKYPQCTCKDLYRWDNGTCKLNCTRNSCSTTTYPLTAQNAANASSYEKCTPSCSDESPRYKVSACASGYNVNSNGASCVKEEVPIVCENEDIGWILYGNGFCSEKLIMHPDLIPVAVITDPDQKIAVSLTFIDKNGTGWDGSSNSGGSYGLPDGFTMPWTYNVDNVEDIPDLENCYVGMLGFYSCGTSGLYNTDIIIAQDAGRNIYHAALAARKFTPLGCTAGFCQKGSWWLPSNNEISFMSRSAYASEINGTLSEIGAIMPTSSVSDGKVYWSSNEANNNGQGAFVSTPEYTHTGKYDYRLVRPVVTYGETKSDQCMLYLAGINKNMVLATTADELRKYAAKTEQHIAIPADITDREGTLDTGFENHIYFLGGEDAAHCSKYMVNGNAGPRLIFGNINFDDTTFHGYGKIKVIGRTTINGDLFDVPELSTKELYMFSSINGVGSLSADKVVVDATVIAIRNFSSLEIGTLQLMSFAELTIDDEGGAETYKIGTPNASAKSDTCERVFDLHDSTYYENKHSGQFADSGVLLCCGSSLEIVAENGATVGGLWSNWYGESDARNEPTTLSFTGDIFLEETALFSHNTNVFVSGGTTDIENGWLYDLGSSHNIYINDGELKLGEGLFCKNVPGEYGTYEHNNEEANIYVRDGGTITINGTSQGVIKNSEGYCTYHPKTPHEEFNERCIITSVAGLFNDDVTYE